MGGHFEIIEILVNQRCSNCESAILKGELTMRFKDNFLCLSCLNKALVNMVNLLNYKRRIYKGDFK